MTPTDIRDTAIPETDEIEQIAHRVHVETSDDHTLKWSKQTSKYRNSAKGQVRTLLKAMKAVGFAPLTKRQELSALTAQLDALKEENERTKRALTAFADVADFMDAETEGFAMTDTLNLVIQNEEFPDYLVNTFCLQRFYDARAALTQPQLPESGESVEGGECQECGGTGMRDTGGVHPWGEHISIPCGCKERS